MESNQAGRADLSEAFEDEFVGVRHRIQFFYMPLFRSFCQHYRLDLTSVRVLDCGCGNGISVAYLAENGFWACGVDSRKLRSEKWEEIGRLTGAAFCHADATHLPFADASFDIVFSCGLLEHIGVTEGAPSYSCAQLPDQEEQRRQFLAECLRVLRCPGVLYIDHPNGAFPVDFWHNDIYGWPRFHWPWEKFLPTYGEVCRLARAVDSTCTVEALSPAGRFTFRRATRHWYGKILRAPLRLYFRLLCFRPFSRLAASPFNPYLVLRIARH